ncbi:MAG TPA: hypothetical protein VJP45_02675 [Candidatus Limnocylindria bacterium]|nr:hypothetical protein [Candidatus Limnocylindria bacterium]
MTPDVAIAADVLPATGADACDPACNARARASAKACRLARAQCTLGEIEASLVVDEGLTEADAAEIVADLGVALALHCQAGRAGLRDHLWEAAHGRVDVRQITSTVIALARLLGEQHLGYTPQGVDETIRKTNEGIEREKARNAGSKVKLTTVAGGRAA